MNANVHWFEAHGRITTANSSGVYYSYFSDTAGANRLALHAPGYRAGLAVMTTMSRRVLVTLKFAARPAPGIAVSSGEIQKAKDTLVDRVNALWNQHRLAIKVLPFDATGRRPLGEERLLRVGFQILWTPTGADYVMYVYPTPNDLPIIPGRTDRPPFVRAGVGANPIEMHIAATTPDWTYSHEFGHCIGLPDEYSHPGVMYFRPEGVQGVFLQRPGAFIPADKQGNIRGGVRDTDLRTTMSTNPNNDLLPRHLWPTALEVRKLLNRSGRSQKFGVDVVFSG